MLTGGCACGNVRYRLLAEPYDTGWCHCKVCQRVSGSTGLVFTTLALKDYFLDEGADRVGRFSATPFGERTFCSDCGSPLTIHVRYQSDEIDVTVGSLDDPGAVAPGFHIYVGEAPRWLKPGDGLPTYNALRPETRGLEPGQTDAADAAR